MLDFRSLWPAREPLRQLACVTMARDEDYFIEMYVKHYLMQCPEADFYIVDHASKKTVSAVLAEKFPHLESGRINVIRIPDIPFDDDFKAITLSSIGSMACAAYEVAIISDADELVVPMNGGLVETCLSLPADVIAPLGFEVVQNLRSEPAYDVDAPVFPQRSFGYFKSSQTKPIVWKSASIVGAGLHKCLYDYAFSDQLVAVHMRFADHEQAKIRVEHRRQASFSKNQVERKYGTYWSASGDVRLRVFDDLMKGDPHDFHHVASVFLEDLNRTKSRNPQGYWGPDLSLKSPYCRLG